MQNRRGRALQSSRSLPPSPLHALLCPQPSSANENATATATWRLHACHIHDRKHTNYILIPCLMCETQYYRASAFVSTKKKMLGLIN
jgi:hypothetical protein